MNNLANGLITLTMTVFSNLAILPVFTDAAENWGGTGTYANPAWYTFTSPNGETYQSARGQTVNNQITPGPLGITTVGDSKQIELYFSRRWEGNVLVDKDIGGSETLLFQSSLVLNTNNGPVRVFDRLNYKSGSVKIFPGGFGVNDEFKWVFGGIESSALVAANMNSGSLTILAFKDHELKPGPGVTTEPLERVDFLFSFDLANNGTWDYDYGRDISGSNTHLFENGDFVNMPGFLGTNVVYGNGLGSIVTDYNINSLGIDWIYGVTNAWDFLNGVASHPSQFAYFFVEWTQNYIFKDWPAQFA